MKPSQILLETGEAYLARAPNRPIVSMEHDYLWIGNDAPQDKWCYATLSDKRKLRALAELILRRLDERERATADRARRRAERKAARP